jgi:imidazolonepropionase-like amidohydrolase
MAQKSSSLSGAFWFSLLVGFWFVCFIALPQSLSAAELVIEHVSVVSPERKAPLRDAVVQVRDGRITSIKHAVGQVAQSNSDAVRIDGTGMFLSPGLIDSHVHLNEIPGMTGPQEAEHPDIAAAARRQMPRSYLLYGFTTLIDLVSTPQGVANWKNSSDAVPDTYFCGGAAIMDGYSMNYDPKPQRYHDFPYMLMEPDMQAPDGIDSSMHTPQAVVSRMKADGAICVKTFYEQGFGGVHDLPLPKLETIRQVVKAAHEVGMPVLMHANADYAQTFALDAGVDIIAHGLWNWNSEHSSSTQITPDIQKILDRVVAGNVGWQPTIQVLYGLRDLFTDSYLADPELERVVPRSLIDWYRSPEGQWFRALIMQDEKLSADDPELRNIFSLRLPIERVRHATGYLAAHQARILFGTDPPSAPSYGNLPGLNAQKEMHQLIDAGETPAQIFRSATLVNAQAMKLDRDIGTVQIGKRANLLLLRQDPTQTIEAYSHIAKVILNGRVLDPSELAANTQH